MKKRRSPRKVEISDEVKADWKRRYETTDESVVDIAAAAGFEETFVRRTAKREGWVRYRRPPLGLSPAAKLAAQAERLAEFVSRRDAAGIEATVRAVAPLAASEDERERVAATFERDVKAAAGAIVASIRAHAVEIETLRGRLKTTGRRPTQVSRAVHDLAMLSGAVQRIQSISDGFSIQANDNDDDTHEDIDELRRRVAAAIQAFLDRRPDIGVAPACEPEGPDDDRA